MCFCVKVAKMKNNLNTWNMLLFIHFPEAYVKRNISRFWPFINNCKDMSIVLF